LGKKITHVQDSDVALSHLQIGKAHE